MKEFNLDKFLSTPLPTEEEIISSWQGDTIKPVVSVVCLTYNQDKYIEDAIRGFLIQRTSFPFEVIIHDDASTDSTAKKILEYKERYPNIIKPVIQAENQYSKSPFSVMSEAFKVASGEYVAICEGDDFWIDEVKLQSQFSMMKLNPEIKICFHTCHETGGAQVKQLLKRFLLYPKKVGIVDAGEIIRNGGGYMPTASIFMKKTEMINFPDWFSSCPVGDYFMQIILANPGGALFSPKVMSVYRKFADGSWSEKISKSSEFSVAHSIKMADSLNKLKLYFSSRYGDEIDGVINLMILSVLLNKYIDKAHKERLISFIPESVMVKEAYRAAQSPHDPRSILIRHVMSGYLSLLRFVRIFKVSCKWAAK
ncbi:glycosyltransferase family 2 protein [Metapseudomonas boanensis]|uniref:Glycosyltransferase family 2 protein n=1 Tax=Metapseudomonas boanensis TaxID=2822138 RepID=A0ABS5XDM2_9GAMM|nr:glycosyltransferase family A protein [Pseudomonas boanensis]MBT8765793.1 glycosyltransferase family 2 protein [Pseudomonas boanensis]